MWAAPHEGKSREPPGGAGVVVSGSATNAGGRLTPSSSHLETGTILALLVERAIKDLP